MSRADDFLRQVSIKISVPVSREAVVGPLDCAAAAAAGQGGCDPLNVDYLDLLNDPPLDWDDGRRMDENALSEGEEMPGLSDGDGYEDYEPLPPVPGIVGGGGGGGAGIAAPGDFAQVRDNSAAIQRLREELLERGTTSDALLALMVEMVTGVHDSEARALASEY